MSASDYSKNDASSLADDRSVGELERDAQNRRERVGETLNELENRLSPDRWVDNAVGLFKEHGGEISDGLQRSVKRNPLPVILTGIGIAWMMLGQRDDGYGSRGGSGRRYPAYRQPQYGSQHIPSSIQSDTRNVDDEDDGEGLMDRVGSVVGDARDSVSRSARDMQSSARQQMSSVRRTSADAAGDLEGQLSDYRQLTGERAEEWASDAQRFLQEQPLVAGGMGIALGALLGALLPTSESEQRLARQAVQSDTGQKAIDDVKSAAQSAQEKVHGRIDDAAKTAKAKIDEAKSEVSTET